MRIRLFLVEIITLVRSEIFHSVFFCKANERFVHMVFFSDAFADQLDPDGACFPRDAGGTQTVPVAFAGTPNTGTSSTASVGDPVIGSYFFDGNDLNGAAGVKYILRVSGTVTSGTFPPEVGDSATISYDAATMEVEAKGKGKSQSVCVGPMSISATVEFTGIN